MSADHTRTVIVYVEDNASSIALMRAVVDDFPNIVLLVATSAERGLELVREHRPDLVVMDIGLPAMSGIEAMSHLAEQPETREVPVIALTAAVMPRDRARAQDVGFSRYLTKPIDVGELRKAFAEFLPESAFDDDGPARSDR